MSYYSNWLKNRYNFTYRQGPVPYTRCWRGGVHYCRRIRTTQEIRENSFLEYDEELKEYGFQPSSRRTRSSLPTAWDDAPVSRFKSWKKYRKTQWKNKQ